MSQQQILREYLVALGFRVNTSEQKRMDGVVKNLDKRVLALGKAAVTTATAVVTMATVFARQMEKLYYSARYADTAVEKMQDLSYGASQVGIEGGRMQAVMKSFAATIRSNPGLVGLLNSLGVKVQGRDKGDVMLDFVKALKGMPFYVAEKYAALFGMDPETLFNMQAGLEEIKKAAEQRRVMAAEAGLDAEEAAKVGKEYMTMWREVEARAGIFAQTLMISALPAVQEILGVTNEVLKDWTNIVKRIGESKNNPNAPGFWQSMWDGTTGIASSGERAVLTEEQKKRIGAPMSDLQWPVPANNPLVPDLGGFISEKNRYQLWRDRKTGRRFSPRMPTDAAAVEAASSPGWNVGGASASDAGAGGGSTPSDLFAQLEAKYGLPPGLLDRVWARESSRGQNMRSPKGALGHFGFMPKTSAEYGLTGKENDLNASADASARKWRDLLQQFGGDIELAAAAYNWGEGNMSRYGLGKMPKETQDYVKDVAGGLTVNQDVNINISGTGDPQQAAQAVAREQKNVGAEIVRNYKSKVR